MIDSIFKILASVLSIVEDEVRRKYQDKVYELSKEWYAEKSKTQDKRDNARLDFVRFELQLILDNLSSELKPKDT
jgi:hypothetical protein